ncbi:MAG: tetratricopeptide repeat protein, partial [Bacteroidota bacterium]
MQRIFLLTILSSLISCGKDNETQKQRFLLRGNEALKQQNYREAQRFYNEALALDSCYVPAVNNLGILSYQSSQYGEAVLYYDRAIDCDPTFMDAQINRANAFYELNELFRALDDLAYVEKQLPDTSYVHFMKGLVLTKMRKYRDALGAFDRTLELDSANAEVWVNRGSVYYYLGELDKAQSDLDQALQLDPLES